MFFNKMYLAFFIAAKKREYNVNDEKSILKSMESSLNSAYEEAFNAAEFEILHVKKTARKAILRCIETGEKLECCALCVLECQILVEKTNEECQYVHTLALCIQRQSDQLEKFWTYFKGLDESQGIAFDDLSRLQFTEWRSVRSDSFAFFPVPSLEYAQHERCSFNQIHKMMNYSAPICAFAGILT
jgi:hypothetical protein